MTVKQILIGAIVGAIFGYAIFVLAFREVIEDVAAKNGVKTRFLELEIEYYFLALFGLCGACFNTVQKRVKTVVSSIISNLYESIKLIFSVRCLFTLCIPSICGRTGRALLYSFLFTLIFKNPVQNTVYKA